MSFKIVQITDQKKTYLTVVPSAWERLGTLYYPNTTNLFIMQKLIQNPRSIPERYWLSQSCILKKTNFRTFEGAGAEIERMNENSDNKGFVNDTTNFPRPRKRHRTPSDNADQEVTHNQKILKNLLLQEADVNTKTSTNEHLPKRDNNSETYLRGETDYSSPMESMSTKIDQILKKQNKIIMQLTKQREFNEVVKDRLDQINNSLKINKTKSSKKYMNKESSVEDDSDAISIVNLLNNPISRQEELNELEINLNDTKNMEYLISKMKVICGETGLLEATFCCYSLVDHFFTRSFLLNVSWSGGSRTDVAKTVLKNYRNVLCVFNKLVILASKDFDENKSQEFFQTVIANSKIRYAMHQIPEDPPEQAADVVLKISPDDCNTISISNLLIDPICNEDELDELELNLKDDKNVENLITRMKRICGETGLLDSTNCCYSLVDRFFTRSFLINVSWSGGSRTGSSKLALRTYRNTLDVFNRLVQLASKDFDEHKSREFFKMVLKNSKQRFISEIDHIPRKSAKKDADLLLQILPDGCNKISIQKLLNDPISNEEELDKLELNLNDDKNAEYLIAKMKRICGETGLLDSTNCCYTLVDRFFTRAFLVNVTWSGGSRTGGSKLALKTYKNTLDVFNRLVTLASKDFDEYKSREFFKVVLKNSKQRFRSEIDHIPRKSAKKARKQKEQVTSMLDDSENNTTVKEIDDAANDDGVVDFKCEFESVAEN